MGRGHLRGDHPGRRRRRGDLPGNLRRPRHAHPVSSALPDVHPVRGHADAGADRDAEANHKWKGNPDGDPDADPGPHPDREPDPVQPGAAGLPDAATPTECFPDADAQDESDRRRRDPDASADTYPDAGPDHPAELHATAHRDPDTDTVVGLSGTGLRGRRAACCRSRG